MNFLLHHRLRMTPIEGQAHRSTPQKFKFKTKLYTQLHRNHPTDLVYHGTWHYKHDGLRMMSFKGECHVKGQGQMS